MSRRILTVLAGFLLALTTFAGAPQALAADPGGPSASQLLAKVTNCQQISNGKYATDEGQAATIPVCQANGAVFFKADMDVDCDGQRTAQCNEQTDCCFYPDTAFHTSTDQPLDAAKLPYIVLPSPSPTWDYRTAGIDGGAVVAVIYNNQVTYAVVGDTGPTGIIGESSYATAQSLGINPDPKNGGTDSGVTYIVFPHSQVNPIESHANAVSLGQQLATQFVGGGGGNPPPPTGGTITGLGGKCVDVAGANNTNGTAVQLYDCNGTTAQQWTVGGDGAIKALGKCLDVAGANAANGTKVQLWDCNGSAAQNWSRPGDGTIRALGKCLDATNNSSANGTRLQIWDCGGSANQKWTVA
jgi:hypothetical protein